MINQKSAQTLIDSMSHLFRIDMSIINERGVIIASNQIKLIGKFHPIANEMIEQRLKEKVERTPTGAIIKRYLLLMQESHPYGVISISGSGADNDQLVQLLQYDVKKQLIPQIDRQRTNINGMSEIFNSLFRESPVNYEKVNEAFFKFHYSLNALRLPALVHFTNASGTDAAYKRLKLVLDEDAQNMMFRYSEYDILFFVRLSYKESLHPRTAELERAITQATASISSYKLAYTVPTDDIRFYGISFSQLVWLMNIYGLLPAKCFSIIDALDLLLISSDGWENYNNVFIYYKKRLEAHNVLEDFLTLAEVLIQHNMNYNEAAKALFVHKNTIVFRMNKIKNLLEINPYRDLDHLALFSYLYYYIQLERHALLSFQKVRNKISPSHFP